MCYIQAMYTMDSYLIIVNNSRLIHGAGRFILVISALVGFSAFDALYTTVVINYISQCELVIYFLRSTFIKVRTKSRPLQDEIKVIENCRTVIISTAENVSKYY